MSDEIREAFENIESDINELIEYQTSKYAALCDLELIKKAYTSQDDEISELVEALKLAHKDKWEFLSMLNTNGVLVDGPILDRFPLEIALLSRYTKTPEATDE